LSIRTVARALAECRALERASITVCLAARAPGDDSITLHRLQLSDRLAEAILTTAGDSLRKLSSEVAQGDKVLVQYDAATRTDFHEVEVHDPPTSSVQRAVIADLDDLHSVRVFDGDARTIRNLAFHVLAIQRRGQPAIYIFRS
jgi:hypothetical protein